MTEKPAEKTAGALPVGTIVPKAIEPSCTQMASELRKHVGKAWSDQEGEDLAKAFADRGMEAPPTMMLRRFYTPSEVILTGTTAGIAEVARIISETRSITLVLLADSENYRSVREGWVMQRYRLVDKSKGVEMPPTSVGEVVRIASAVRSSNKKEWEVYADPNYLIQSNDLGVGGSPWYIDGSPHGGKTKAVKAALLTQWAFTATHGIDLNSNLSYPGEGATVYVFDTSPFAKGIPSQQPWLDPKLPWLEVLSDPPQWPVPNNPCNISDHGVFVAGLVHTVAPSSMVYLIPVLDEYGMGTLYPLADALAAYVKQSKTNTKDVLNLSLGVHWDPGAFGLTAQEGQIIAFFDDSLTRAYNKGAVIVAAAGNNGALSMDRPAFYPYVIGVVASNDNGDQSCFSNSNKSVATWVMAPGGDGIAKQGDSCQPRAHECKSADCKTGVVSLVPVSTYPEGYAYWSGTSFATPLVSGLAARVLNASASLPAGSMRGDAVFTAIDCGAQKHGRVISVAATLAKDCLP